MKLTQKVAASIEPGKSRFVWDDSLPGFGVRVSAKAVSYVVDFRIGRKRRRVVLGPVAAWQYGPARDRAKAILVGARQGVDLTLRPLSQPTFAECWSELIEQVDRPRLAEATIKDYEDRADRLILPKIGRKAIGDVSQGDVDRVLAATPGDRNRAYVAALIKKTINYAIRSRILPKDHNNPADDVKLKKPARAGRALDMDELSRFGAALRELETERTVSPWIASLFRLSLICGLRPGEAKSLTWERVSLDRRKMTVVGKTGARDVYLTDEAIDVLRRTPKVEGNRFVFVGRNHGEHVRGLHKALGAIADRAGLERFRPYDLRHSAATGALASGADVRAVQAMMGHADLQTTAGYLHDTPARRRAAAEGAAKFGRGVLKVVK